ncbi:MAG TPA: HAD-IIB family hydrolase [Stellaceae bacterium]|nr:HAD-IIB family hydrolase [Stellaceae bacterium]
MRPLAEFPVAGRSAIRYVLTDVDDTLTHAGRLSAETYGALARLQRAGIKVMPVTAASAGWCDLIARMWPVDAVIGENGGLCFSAGDASGAMRRYYWSSDAERREHNERLTAIGKRICRLVPHAALSPDQHYRETTLALADGDGVLPDRAAVESMLRVLDDAGAQTTVNSMWVLGWLGGFDKLAMTQRMMRELFAIDVAILEDAVLYVGDSLNDEPMFRFFVNSVGVSTVRRFLDRLRSPPRWVTRGPGGVGFVEVAKVLLAAR